VNDGGDREPDPKPTFSQEYAGLGGLEAARRFLREVGEPKETTEIFEALKARGWKSASGNPLPSVYAMLRKAKDIEPGNGKWFSRRD
jgi:hypothetical protein